MAIACEFNPRNEPHPSQEAGAFAADGSGDLQDDRFAATIYLSLILNCFINPFIGTNRFRLYKIRHILFGEGMAHCRDKTMTSPLTRALF